MSKAEKIDKRGKKGKVDIFTLVIRILFVVAFFVGVITGLFGNTTEQFIAAFTALVGLALTFIPEAAEKLSNKKLRFSNALKLAIVLFIFLAEFLGEMKDFYYKFSWWDSLLHLSSGIILGMIGFSMVYVLNQSPIDIKLSAGFVAIFAFMFAATCAGLWEIFEFSGDRLLGMDMQKYKPPAGTTELVTDAWSYDAGLVDTMIDLIYGMSTALVVSITGYFYLKREEKKEKKPTQPLE